MIKINNIKELGLPTIRIPYFSTFQRDFEKFFELSFRKKIMYKFISFPYLNGSKRVIVYGSYKDLSKFITNFLLFYNLESNFTVPSYVSHQELDHPKIIEDFIDLPLLYSFIESSGSNYPEISFVSDTRINLIENIDMKDFDTFYILDDDFYNSTISNIKKDSESKFISAKEMFNI